MTKSKNKILPSTLYSINELKKKGIDIAADAVLAEEAVELLYQKWRQR